MSSAALFTPTRGASTRAPRRRAIAAATAGLALALTVVVAGPASAAGSGHRDCWGGSTVYGNWNSIGATSDVGGFDDCGNSAAAYRYWGTDGVVRWGLYSWSSGIAYAAGPTGSIGLGGKHTVASPAPLLSYQFPFTT